MTDDHLMKTCPDCAEDIRAEARKCRYCGYRFDSPPAAAERPVSDADAGIAKAPMVEASDLATAQVSLSETRPADRHVVEVPGNTDRHFESLGDALRDAESALRDLPVLWVKVHAERRGQRELLKTIRKKDFKGAAPGDFATTTIEAPPTAAGRPVGVHAAATGTTPKTPQVKPPLIDGDLRMAHTTGTTEGAQRGTTPTRKKVVLGAGAILAALWLIGYVESRGGGGPVAYMHKLGYSGVSCKVDPSTPKTWACDAESWHGNGGGWPTVFVYQATNGSWHAAHP